jgi:hypothetical protein
MSTLVVFALGFLGGCSLVTLVASWFDQPDPSMSTASALQLIAGFSAIGCIAATLVFAIALLLSERVVLPFPSFVSGILTTFATVALMIAVHAVLPPALSSPWTLLVFLVVIAAAVPWLAGREPHVDVG